MKIVYKNLHITDANDASALSNTSDVLKAIYKAVETCIVRQLYPDNYKFHA